MVKKQVKKYPVQFMVGMIFIVFFIANISIHLTGFGDDTDLFLNPLVHEHGNSIWAFLTSRYQNWSSRIIIEAVVLILVKHPILWKVGNAVAMTLCVCLPPYLLGGKERLRVSDYLLSFSLFLLVPISMFSETGWIATTTNYLWAYAAGWVAVLPFVKEYSNKLTARLVYVCSLIAVLYAANQEQMAVLLLIVFTVCFITSWSKNGRWYLVLPQIILTIMNLVLIKASPGNQLRYKLEVQERFPDFGQLSLFKKIELGFSSSFKQLFFDRAWLVIVLGILIIVVIFHYYQSYVMRGLAIFPLVVFLVFGFPFLLPNSEGIAKIIDSFNQYGTNIQWSAPKTWYPDLLLLAVACCILVCLFLCFKEFRERMIGIGLLFLATISRMIMGFSPTIWASATRTFLFTQLLIAVVILLLYTKTDISEKQKGTFLAVIFAVSLVIGFNQLVML